MRLKARNRIVTGALVLLVMLVVLGALLTGAPPARAAETFTLAGRSGPVGMATDHAHGRYWVLERGSGRLQLTALDASGVVQGQMSSRDTLTNAQALAFTDDGVAWVGDVGGRRTTTTVYQVIQPWPGTEILHAVAYRLTYPDGAHDAAAIVVDDHARIHVITRGDAPGVYRAPEAPSPTEANGLERIADAPADVTDAVALVDGRWALRTATSVTVLDPTTFAVLGTADIGVVERGQALAQGLTATDLLTAAGPNGEVTSMTIPGPAPTVAPTPRPTKAAAVSEAAGDANPTRTFQQTGTTVALLAAIVLACGLAVIVLIRR